VVEAAGSFAGLLLGPLGSREIVFPMVRTLLREQPSAASAVHASSTCQFG
jgi:hypothetical protein